MINITTNTETGINKIHDRFLRPNYLFVLEFNEGFIFGRILRRRICAYNPCELTDAMGAKKDIPPNTHQSELRFRDPRSPADDILFLNAATNAGHPWFLHGSIGIKPSQINMYPRFPEGREIPGKFPNIDTARPLTGDNFGFINSDRSSFDAPTDFYEYIIPPMSRISAEYYNHDPERHHLPVLNILFSLYWFEPLTLATNGPLIQSIAARRVPATFLTVGFGDIPFELGDALKAAWKVTPISLSRAIRGK